MKTHVEFKSDKFPPYEGEEERINPGVWGKRLAEYLVEKLKERGTKTEEIIAEDWGWFIPIQSEGTNLALCVGHLSGDDNEFACFTNPTRPTGRRWLRKFDVSSQLLDLTEILRSVLESDPEIYEIKWYEPD